MFLHHNSLSLNPCSNPKLQDVYLHTTLQRIDYLANEDVEMKVNVPRTRYESLIYDARSGTFVQLRQLRSHRHESSAASS